MSLFENDLYRWRETYFVLFHSANRPKASQVQDHFRKLGGRYELQDLRADPQGQFESVTLISPYDFAAMDISYVVGEDVAIQVSELREEMSVTSMTAEERAKFERLLRCDARFDIYHFEQLMNDDEGDEDEFMDPGALLLVIEQLTQICGGVGIDPQSGSLM